MLRVKEAMGGGDARALHTAIAAAERAGVAASELSVAYARLKVLRTEFRAAWGGDARTAAITAAERAGVAASELSDAYARALKVLRTEEPMPYLLVLDRGADNFTHERFPDEGSARAAAHKVWHSHVLFEARAHGEKMVREVTKGGLGFGHAAIRRHAATPLAMMLVKEAMGGSSAVALHAAIAAAEKAGVAASELSDARDMLAVLAGLRVKEAMGGGDAGALGTAIAAAVTAAVTAGVAASELSEAMVEPARAVLAMLRVKEAMGGGDAGPLEAAIAVAVTAGVAASELSGARAKLVWLRPRLRWRRRRRDWRR
jgi:hypothetical protein